MMLWDHGHPNIQSTPVFCVYRYIDYLASFQLYFVFIINSSLVLVYILYNVLGKCTFVCIILYLATYYVSICTHVDCVES